MQDRKYQQQEVGYGFLILEVNIIGILVAVIWEIQEMCLRIRQLVWDIRHVRNVIDITEFAWLKLKWIY